MHFVFRAASCATRRSSLLQTSPVRPPASSLSCAKRLVTRYSSTGPKRTANNEVNSGGANEPPRSQVTSIRRLPTPPPRPKGTPPTISTHDIEEYVQPLYARGWGLSPILPNGNGIAVLRKRFEFASADGLEEFLADLSGYEKKMHHHAKTNVVEGQHAVLVSTWTHVARRRPDAGVEDKDEKMQGVTVRDIRLAYALEKVFESALAAGGREYIPHVRPEADRPKTVEELEGYT